MKKVIKISDKEIQSETYQTLQAFLNKSKVTRSNTNTRIKKFNILLKSLLEQQQSS